MTRLDFHAACGLVSVAPAIALENDELVEALMAKDDELVIKILKEQF